MAYFWWKHGFLRSISKLRDDRYDLRDDFSSSHDEYIISFSYSLLRELIIVMECRSTYHDTTDIDCFEIRYGSHGTSTPDRVLYRYHSCTDLLCWELVRDSIAWMMLSASEIIPERHIIELQDYTIDIEVEVLPSISRFLF